VYIIKGQHQSVSGHHKKKMDQAKGRQGKTDAHNTFVLPAVRDSLLILRLPLRIGQYGLLNLTKWSLQRLKVN
jgi:hypothetical protein